MEYFLALIIFFLIKPAHADTGAMLLGGAGSVLVHESGHALTSHFLGGEILAFKPYPNKVRYENPDGSYEDKWVLGVVMTSDFTGESSESKSALVAAMGSGSSLLSVFFLAPLLPSVSSEFGKNTLDSMLFISSLDAPSYILADLIFKNKTGDWTKVSKITGISLYWYLAGFLVTSYLANEYRYYFHQQAFDKDTSTSHFAVGFTAKFN